VTAGTPAAEIEVDAALVQALLREQHPQFASLPIRAAGSGWDNFLFRLGEDLAVRLPRRAIAAPLIEHEQQWLPRLAGRLSLPVPAPLRVGHPAQGYPWRWSIVPWLRGEPAGLSPPREDQGVRLGEFLAALHAPAPSEAPRNIFRGVPLMTRVPVVEERMRRLEQKSGLITPTLRGLWQTALAAPIDVDETWLHGDLHGRNVLVEDGVISGVVDWGDICRGDRATDLAVIWSVFDTPTARAAARRACGPVSEATWLRARGWAISFGVVLLDSGLTDDPQAAVMGERTLKRVAEDA
jgi:aminoglycoside phosphotransferase (APT) family kinase protein